MERNPSPRQLLDAAKEAKRSFPALAAAAGISFDTVYRAHRTDTWPAQERPRLALARVLGLTHDPMSQAGDVEAAGGGTHAAQPSAPGVA